MLTYNSGADGCYISKSDIKAAGLPVLRPSTKLFIVANGKKCKGTSVTQLPFPKLSKKATSADTFHNFPTSLMSVGKTADDGKISIFTKEGVKVYNKLDFLIMCKGKTILIGVHTNHGQYLIPLVQL